MQIVNAVCNYKSLRNYTTMTNRGISSDVEITKYSVYK